MAGCTAVLALPLITIAVLALPTCATSWVRSTAFADRREWALFMPPMHSLVGSWHEVAAIGYAANPQTASVTYYFNVTRTDNGGRSFNSVPPLRWVSNAGMWPMAVDVWKDGNKDVGLIAQASRTFANGTVVNELWVYAPWASKWVAHTLELPKDLPGASNPFIKQAAPILNEFFAVGAVFNAAGGSVECIWHWVASIRTTSWTVTAHSVAQMPGVNRVVAASPNAAWATFKNSGKIVRWTGQKWVQQRAGYAQESMEALAAVAATTTTPAMVWLLWTQTQTGGRTQRLLLCSATACATKKVIGATTKAFPGEFKGLQAAGPNFALVWEHMPTDNLALREVRLQQFNGTAWKLVLRTNVTQQPLQEPWSPALCDSPELLLSVASPSRAVVVLTSQLPVSGTTIALDTRTWNGTGWTVQPKIKLPKCLSFNPGWDPHNIQSVQVQALDSGSAVLALRAGMWHLV